jgi:hypothetical protein
VPDCFGGDGDGGLPSPPGSPTRTTASGVDVPSSRGVEARLPPLPRRWFRGWLS